jgi:transposase
MGYLGLVPSEQSTGEKIRRAGITKAGNRRARRILVECSWSYRHPPRLGKEKLSKVAAVPRDIGEIAWKAQHRLTARYRMLIRNGKKPTGRRHRDCSRAVRLCLGHQPCRPGRHDRVNDTVNSDIV